MLGFSSPLYTLQSSFPHVACQDQSASRLLPVLHLSGGSNEMVAPRHPGIFDFSFSALQIFLSNHFGIYYGALGLQMQLKGVSSTCVFTFSMTTPIRCFPFARKFWALPWRIRLWWMNAYVGSSYYKYLVRLVSSPKGMIFQKEESWADKTMDNTTGGVGRGRCIAFLR